MLDECDLEKLKNELEGHSGREWEEDLQITEACESCRHTYVNHEAGNIEFPDQLDLTTTFTVGGDLEFITVRIYYG